jgi:hypothetical protein
LFRVAIDLFGRDKITLKTFEIDDRVVICLMISFLLCDGFHVELLDRNLLPNQLRSFACIATLAYLGFIGIAIIGWLFRRPNMSKRWDTLIPDTFILVEQVSGKKLNLSNAFYTPDMNFKHPYAVLRVQLPLVPKFTGPVLVDSHKNYRRDRLGLFEDGAISAPTSLPVCKSEISFSPPGWGGGGSESI